MGNNPIVAIDLPRRDEAVAVLCDAFHDYPVMRYVLKDAGPRYEERIRVLLGYFTGARLVRGFPVLGVERAGRLVAVANVDPPVRGPKPPELRRLYREMCATIGDAAVERFHAFADAARPLEPDLPHYYLGTLGVLHEEQGHGHARRLLEHLHGVSLADPASEGVVLTTETPDNRPFYERFGYQILGEANAEELRTWTLLRRDRT